MKTLIEIGSFDGSDSLRFHQLGYKVYTFEPKRDLYTALVQKTKNLNNYTVINKAVCLNNGVQKFNICNSGGASSLMTFKNKDELIKHWSENRTDIHFSGNSYDVETIRLDTFLEQNSIQNNIIDYLHIDAQGCDFDVLKSLGQYISNVKEGVLETAYTYDKTIYVEQTENTLENVKTFLENNNFIITNVIPNDITRCECNVYFKNISN
jgi:FkbM family methyltransferase